MEDCKGLHAAIGAADDIGASDAPADAGLISVGIDVGSTTVKLAVFHRGNGRLVHSAYRRHHASQVECAVALLRELETQMPGLKAQFAVSGSGGTVVAKALCAPFVQEVVANAIAVEHLHPQARTAIELGGQDAKIVFFRKDEATGQLSVSDMRMNGSCAGGTGAFIDEIAGLLNVPAEGFNALAEQGESVYTVSGRCGVYAKTDIQPLLNQGVSKEDLALSAFHAIAKQTIGGLAQGLDIEPPVIFEGGPLTFNPRLITVFAQRLALKPEEIIIPEHPETIVALGAALASDGPLVEEPCEMGVRDAIAELEAHAFRSRDELAVTAAPMFASEEERQAFAARHALPPIPHAIPKDTQVRAYLGIDSGSTTTKLVLLDEDGQLIDSFYSSNEGDPLSVARDALLDLQARWAARGNELEIAALGVTGYGEEMFFRAYRADFHSVETVAHAHAALTLQPNASFVLDIGGQDMKAIWIDRGVITDIVVNEACSSGCGSFLEEFATSLGIPMEEIAEQAFSSQSPAELGSRCTVFMTSSIVTEQRNGKTSADIMAGLCRSVINNLFTKVLRVSNLSTLGEHVVVQGGTFANDAVLRAFEDYLGREVTRSPYPGLMGAIGAALLAREKMSRRLQAGEEAESSFIGFDALRSLEFTREQNVECPFCANHCNRTVTRFSSGAVMVTGNRCLKGEVVGDLAQEGVRQSLKEAAKREKKAPNLYEERQRLLFQRYPSTPVCEPRGITVGIPRVLAFWDTAPFWRTLFEAMGAEVVFSPFSTREMFESGLSSVASDTICFPAKLAHGHVKWLAECGRVDRIWMPIITTIEPESRTGRSESVCAVVKGYPMVIKSSDNPSEKWGIPFDSPLFHWPVMRDRDRQLGKYLQDHWGLSASQAESAIAQADAAQRQFREELVARGSEVLDSLQGEGEYAVVMASRPYHNESLVNHGLPEMFTRMGVAVLTADSLPGLDQIDLSMSRIDVVNNFHARMLGSALFAAMNPRLEYVQVVSFGCGHDAYLTDEIIRLMHEVSDKSPLVLKVDESDATGPLGIRVRSFIETTQARRANGGEGLDSLPSNAEGRIPAQLEDPYPVKFDKGDRKAKVVLIPNTSHAFSMVMAAVFSKQGVKTVPLDIGRENAIRLGKRYVHNDICFPAQIVIGEAIDALDSGKYDPHEVAIGMGKYLGDCRLTHYSALLRKALDDAGYDYVPIITNDGKDDHNMHPGFKMSLMTAIRIAFAMPMIDILEELLRKMRPYERVKGAANKAFDKAMEMLASGLESDGVRGAKRAFAEAISVMGTVEYDRSKPRPRVLIVGEYLLNFHPGANHDIEDYLERNGLEVIEARMADVIHKTYFYQASQIREYGISRPFGEKAELGISDRVFGLAHDCAEKIAAAHPLFEKPARIEDLAKESDDIVHHTFDAGEGILIPGEILHHAKHGVKAFVILQPFGCLPNHVVGRGIAKSLKRRFPDVQILPLDYDPDVSFANVENRLQMLVMNLRSQGA